MGEGADAGPVGSPIDVPSVADIVDDDPRFGRKDVGNHPKVADSKPPARPALEPLEIPERIRTGAFLLTRNSPLDLTGEAKKRIAGVVRPDNLDGRQSPSSSISCLVVLHRPCWYCRRDRASRRRYSGDSSRSSSSTMSRASLMASSYGCLSCALCAASLRRVRSVTWMDVRIYGSYWSSIVSYCCPDLRLTPRPTSCAGKPLSPPRRAPPSAAP